MKDAKSMYRGGDIVEAKHCDFDSAKLLGLVCPFCNEAVYLRAGTVQERRSKYVILNPAFCHYPGSAEDLDCERRSISAEGRREIERIKTEKRGQRLELYNKHLWEMIRTSFVGISFIDQRSRIHRTRRAKLIDQMLVFNQGSFNSFSSFFAAAFTKEEIRSGLLKPVEAEFSERFPMIDNRTAFRVDAIPGFNVYTHIQICSEIIEFLSSRTAGFVWEGLLWSVADFYWGLVDDNKEDIAEFQATGIRERAECVFSAWGCVCVGFVNTPWEAQIERFSNPDRKAADEKYYALLESAKTSAGVKPCEHQS